MTKRKRCPICSKLFAPQGFKKHFNWCVRRDTRERLRDLKEGPGITEQRLEDEKALREHPLPAQNVDTQDIAERLRIDKCAHRAMHPDAVAPIALEPGEIYPSASTFESIVKELKAANLGFVVVVLD